MVVLIFNFLALFLLSCGAAALNRSDGLEPKDTTDNLQDAPSLMPEDIHPPEQAFQPQQQSMPVAFGPEQQNFPPGVNPLTGLPVSDPDLLELPALLISITHFPPQARPQAGLSFSPWVFDYLISSGSTRFLAVFYGSYPNQEMPVNGNCVLRAEPFVQTKAILGNRIWLDLDADGRQDPGEPGIGGVCVNLLDAANSRLLDRTKTDTNGYFGFNVDLKHNYLLEFLPSDFEITQPNVGFEDLDSDANPATGRTGSLTVNGDSLLMDAGFLLPAETPLTPVSENPSGVVGPVRSARLVNIHIQNFFQDSCLIYAGSTREIRDLIPGCAEVFKKGDGGVGSMLEIPRMVSIAEDNAGKRRGIFNYANNLFEEELPLGGQPVNQLDVYVSELNQSIWVYDPSIPGWLRYVDDADENRIGILHPDTDRLTNRQLYFENLLLLYVDHEVLKPAIIDMHLEQGESGKAVLFRTGRMFDIKWSTRAGGYENKTGLRRPIAFLDQEDNPFPLSPGRTWIMIATPYSQIGQVSPGHYKFRLIAPEGAGNY